LQENLCQEAGGAKRVADILTAIFQRPGETV
jgi:hypothetical protein